MNTKTCTWPVALALLALATAGRAQPCPATATLSAPVAGSGVVEQAGSHLSAANLIESGDVIYRAGQSLTPAPGYEVRPGAVFEASIAACESPPARVEGEGSQFTLTAYSSPFARSVLIEYTLPEASPSASASISGAWPFRGCCPGKARPEARTGSPSNRKACPRGVPVRA